MDPKKSDKKIAYHKARKERKKQKKAAAVAESSRNHPPKSVRLAQAGQQEQKLRTSCAELVWQVEIDELVDVSEPEEAEEDKGTDDEVMLDDEDEIDEGDEDEEEDNEAKVRELVEMYEKAIEDDKEGTIESRSK